LIIVKVVRCKEYIAHKMTLWTGQNEWTCAQHQPLRDARILVAEDNAILGYDMKTSLGKAGAHVLGPVRRVADVLAYARSALLSCAVLDVNLCQELVFPAAHVLKERGVGIVFYTGCGEPEKLRLEWPHAQVLVKPAPFRLLMQTICVAGGLCKCAPFAA
jgi:two-component system, response regulator PdtaR